MDSATGDGRIAIGRSGIVVPPLGVGTWTWGERRLWGYGGLYGADDVPAGLAGSGRGRGGLVGPPLGVGTWTWGERRLWGYGGLYGADDVAGAFAASVAAGLTFFDTAEIYGRGASEVILGDLARASAAPVVIAT